MQARRDFLRQVVPAGAAVLVGLKTNWLERVVSATSAVADCDAEELAITRNASEGLQIAQLGIDLHPGDEVLTTNQDYGRMLDTWEQRVLRDKIKLTKISFP